MISLLSAAPITWFQPESPAAFVPSSNTTGPESTKPPAVMGRFIES
jgi:hypothetical protein